jgi:MFS transporter, DHA2 family, multidrug resistance protein
VSWWRNPPLAPPQLRLATIVLLVNVITANVVVQIGFIGSAILMSTMEGQLGYDPSMGFWTGKAFLLLWALMIPFTVRLARWYGHKLMFVLGMVIATLGAALTLNVEAFSWMILARIVSGVGSGMVFALGIDLIIQHCPKRWRSLSLLIFSNMSFGIGIGGGLLLGGWLAQIAHWRAMFYFDLVAYPLMIAVTVLVQPETKRLGDPPFHWVGYLCSVVWVTAWLVLVTESKAPWNTLGWASPMSIGLFGLGLAAFCVMLIHGRFHDNPLFMPKLFGDPAYSLGTLGMLVVGLMVFGVILVSIDMLQGVFRYEPMRVGMVMSTIGFTYFVVGFIPGLLRKWVAMEWYILPGLGLVALSCWMSQHITIQSGPHDLIRIFIVRASGIALVIGPLTVLALSRVPEHLAHKGSVVILYLRLIIAAYGSSIVLTIKNTRAPFHMLRFGEMVNTQSARYKQYIAELSTSLIERGLTASEAAEQAKLQVAGRIVDQAELAGLIDAIYILGWAVVGLMVAISALMIWNRVRRKKDEEAVLVPSR